MMCQKKTGFLFSKRLAACAAALVMLLSLLPAAIAEESVAETAAPEVTEAPASQTVPLSSRPFTPCGTMLRP